MNAAKREHRGAAEPRSVPRRIASVAPLLRGPLLSLLTLAGCGFEEPVLFGQDSGALVDRDSAVIPDTPVTSGPQPGTAVIAGQDHACVLESGQLSCWGANDQGQLGIGDTKDRNAAVAVAADRRFAEVCGGRVHTCALEVGTGAVLCWGDGSQGQLGQSLTGTTSPQRVPLPLPATSIACGYDHACAVLGDGTLSCWGRNSENQLGRGAGTPFESAPERVTGGIVDWVRVGASDGHTAGIRSDGSLWCWGRNESGECGLGAGAPVQIFVPTHVGTDVDWVRVVLGQNATCGLRSDDSLWCWGSNDFGDLGFPPPTGSTVPHRVDGPGSYFALAVETFHGGGIQRDGSLWTWGRNVEGQLGTGDNADRTKPTAVGGSQRWIGIATGRFHTCALRADKQVLCAGENKRGQLGTGDFDRRNVFQPIAR